MNVKPSSGWGAIVAGVAAAVSIACGGEANRERVEVSQVAPKPTAIAATPRRSPTPIPLTVERIEAAAEEFRRSDGISPEEFIEIDEMIQEYSEARSLSPEEIGALWLRILGAELTVAEEEAVAAADATRGKVLSLNEMHAPTVARYGEIGEREARAALQRVGLDPQSNAIWIQAINDPTLSDSARSNLIEDLNEDGFANPRRLTRDDLPMIVNRLALIAELEPYAMDRINAEAFAEAKKDLNNMYNRLIRP
jgi:hypothetical protein